VIPLPEPILVVDDDDAFRTRLTRALADRGYAVTVASGIEEARRSIGATPPASAVLDLRLGDGDGLDLLHELLAAVPSCRAMVLTGYGSIATAVSAMRAGAHNFVAKPVDVDDVIAALGDPPRPIELAPGASRSLARVEWETIQRVLAECDGNVSETARRLGLHRRTLQRKLAKYPPPEE